VGRGVTRPTGATAKVALLLCLVGTLLLADGSAPAPRYRASGHLVANGVEVTVTLVGTLADGTLADGTLADGTLADGTVAATFRPQQPGFHLYSVALPEQGVGGLGIPTRLAAGTDLRPGGGATANRPVRALRLPGLGLDLPVYPDGPVTVVLPVRRTGPHPSVLVSYGACSATRCLVPVRAVAILLTAPAPG